MPSLIASVTLLLALCASAETQQKEHDAEQDARVVLLQTGLDVQADAQQIDPLAARAIQAAPPLRSIPTRPDVSLLRKGTKQVDSDPEESWIMPTGKPVVHIGTVVGSTTDVVDGNPLRCLEASCEYGVLLTEELRRVGRDIGYETQVALYNFWGLDQTLPKGDITVGDIQANHPNGDNTSYFKLRGDALVEVLENMLSQHGPLGEGGSTGSWLQMAGLRFQATWDALESDNSSTGAFWSNFKNGVLGVNETTEATTKTGKWTLQNAYVDLDKGRWAPIDPNYSYNVVSNHQVRFGVLLDHTRDRTISVDMKGSSIADIMVDVFEKRSPVSPPNLDDRELMARMNEQMGVSEVRFNMDGCRDHACAYGILACDEFRRVGRELGFGTHIAFYSGALFRAPLRKGNVYVKDLLNVHPNGNLLSFFQLSGSTIRDILQNMLDDHAEPGSGNESSWMQVAGLRFQASWNENESFWTMGPVHVDVDEGSWLDLVNDQFYSVVTAASLLDRNRTDTVAKIVSRNAVLQERPIESGPAVVAVMAGLFRYYSPVTPPLMDDRQCLAGNCSWLPTPPGVVDAEEEDAVAEGVKDDEDSSPWWQPRAKAGYDAATADVE